MDPKQLILKILKDEGPQTIQGIREKSVEQTPNISLGLSGYLKTLESTGKVEVMYHLAGDAPGDGHLSEPSDGQLKLRLEALDRAIKLGGSIARVMVNAREMEGYLLGESKPEHPARQHSGGTVGAASAEPPSGDTVGEANSII